MPWRIDPGNVCATVGCRRPRATDEPVCTPCSRLARAAGRIDRAASSTAIDPHVPEAVSEPGGFAAAEGRPPRCIAYLSRDGDVITLELTGDPKFTERDVRAAVAALSRRSRAA